jgi:hypothetical protein
MYQGRADARVAWIRNQIKIIRLRNTLMNGDFSYVTLSSEFPYLTCVIVVITAVRRVWTTSVVVNHLQISRVKIMSNSPRFCCPLLLKASYH